MIARADLLVGMRLHSLLFAVLGATAAVALAYDPKVRSLARRAGHEELCLDLTELDRLPAVLADAWAAFNKASPPDDAAQFKAGWMKARAEALAKAALAVGVSE